MSKTELSKAGAWIPLTDWKALPAGEWLVKVESDHREYHVATVTLNNSGDKIIVAGGVFYFDIGKLIAYTSFIKYEK